MAIDYTSLRRELQQIKENVGNAELIELVDRLILELERDRNANRRRLDRFTDNLRDLDGRLLNVENSRIFRMLQNAGRFFESGNAGPPWGRTPVL